MHRLLKNDISHHEYALFTQALVNEWPQATAPAWAQREEGSQERDAQTRVRIDAFVKNDLVLRVLFTLLVKKKLTNRFQASGEKLKHYCEELYNTQRTLGGVP